jgi:hypothetical protein
MAGASGERAFSAYKRRYLPVVFCATAFGTWFAAAVALLSGPVLAVPVFIALELLLIDRLLMVGNGWLRERVAERLGRFGERVNPVVDRFVGLAHPCHLKNSSRRVVETDDDVGYLRVDSEGLHYLGDAVSFDIPPGAIAEVRLSRSFYAPWNRVEVTTTEGEPFDSVIFDSRHYSSHTRCREDNAALYRLLRDLTARRPPVHRLTAVEIEEELAATA